MSFHRTLAARHGSLAIILPDQVSPPAAIPSPEPAAAPQPNGWQAETTTTFLVFMAIGFAATVAAAALLTAVSCSIRCAASTVVSQVTHPHAGTTRRHLLLRRRQAEQRLHRRTHSLSPEDVVVVQNPGGDGALVMAIKLNKALQGVFAKAQQLSRTCNAHAGEEPGEHIKVEMQPQDNVVMLYAATTESPRDLIKT